MAEDGDEQTEPTGDRAGLGGRTLRWASHAERVALPLLGLVLALVPPEVTHSAPVAAADEATVVPDSAEPPVAPTREPPALPDQEAPLGWVIDGAGAPVSGVEVSARPADATDQDAAVTLGATSDEGAFAATGLDDGAYALALRGDSIFPAEVRWQLPGPPVRVMVTRRHAIEGVVTSQGEPTPGALVMLSDGSGASLQTTADEKGAFRFDDLVAGLYEIWSRAKGRASPVVGVPRFGSGPHPPVEIALEPATEVRGRVIDRETRSGLAASVLLSSPTGAARDRALTTDANGYFAFDSVRAGRYSIEADSAGYFATTTYAVRVDADEPETAIELRLRRGGVALGQVVDMRGDPVVGAVLVLGQRGAGRGLAYTAVQRAQRARRFSGGALATADQAHARWVHPLAGNRQLPLYPGRRFGAARSGQRPAECGAGHCGVDLGTVRGAVVHAASDGTVLSVVREPRGLAGRFVSITHVAGIKTAYMHLDHVRLDLEPGQTIRAGEPIGTVGRTGVRVSGPHLHFAMSQKRGDRYWFIDPEPMLRHAVVLPEPASLEAFETGAPGGGHEATRTLVATLPTTVFGDNPLFPRPDVGEAVARRFETDAEGRFSVDGLAPGRYIASATHPELAQGSSAPFQIRAGKETSGILVKLSSGVVLFGRVTSATGPVSGARVVAESGRAEYAREAAEAVTDDVGNYELAPLAGRLTLRVSAQGFGHTEREVTLSNRAADVVRRDESFELEPANAEINGRVLDPDGFPLRGAHIAIVSGPSGGGRATLTDENGNFTFEALSKGAYGLRITSPDYPSASARATTGERVTLSAPQGGGARLLIRDAHTHVPIPGVEMKATGPGGAYRKVVTDADGRAELVPLTPGTWRFDVRLAGYVRTVEKIEVPAGREPRAITVERAVVDLARGATLAGVVRDQNGDRVAGAKVSTGGVDTTTDQDGRFRLVDVPTGSIQLKAERSGERGSIELELDPGDEFVTLQITLQP